MRRPQACLPLASTCRRTRQSARRTSAYAPRTDRAASPNGAPTAQRSVGLSLRVRKDRAASLQHAHAGESVGPSLRVRIGPRDGPKARARNPGQDTKCTLRSSSQNSPQLWSSQTGLATQCNHSRPFYAPLGLGSLQCTLSAASDNGPRAATLRQTTLRLHCRAQLAQSTSKSLSQNIVGRTN